MTDFSSFIEENARERDSFNGRIAMVVAVLSAFLAVTNIYSDNVADEERNAQITALDTWNQYQAKRMRQFMLQAMTSNAEAIRTDEFKQRIDKAIADWAADIGRYKQELGELSTSARASEAEFKAASDIGSLFDLSNALSTIGLALFAITALTRKRALFWVASALAGAGVMFGMGGFAGATWLLPSFY